MQVPRLKRQIVHGKLLGGVTWREDVRSYGAVTEQRRQAHWGDIPRKALFRKARNLQPHRIKLGRIRPGTRYKDWSHPPHLIPLARAMTVKGSHMGPCRDRALPLGLWRFLSRRGIDNRQISERHAYGS